MNKILLNMYYIYSYSPLLLISDDNNFGTLETTIKEDGRIKENIRFSLIGISLGSSKIYIITYSKRDRFRFFHRIYLNQYFKDENTDEKIDKMAIKYKEHLIKLKAQSDIEIEREFLRYRIDSESNRKNIANDKINLYSTIVLALIPLILIYFDLKKLENLEWYNLIGVMMLGYLLINIILLILQVTKVSGITMSTFGELKSEQNNKSICLNTQYYYDWQQIKLSAELLVSYIKNIEKWIKATIILSLILTISINTYTQNKSTGMKYKDEIISLHSEELKDLYSKTSIELSKLHYYIRCKAIGKITIITKFENSVEDRFLEEFDRYKPKLKVKYIKDINMDSNIIKIIVEE